MNTNTNTNTNTNANDTLAAARVRTLKFCPQMDTDIDLRQTFEECIESHECFSDDPCPLHGQFNKTQQKDVK